MMFNPNFVFIGLPHSGSRFLRGYFSFHDQISWTRQAKHFMKQEFDPEAYFQIAPPANGKILIDVGELLAINFLIPADIDTFEKNRFALNFNLSGQELAAPELIATRIKTTLPDARIIMVLRNQIAWLQSHYLYHIQNLPVGNRAFGDYVNCLDGKRVTRAGLFHSTIATYYQVFGKENVHVMLLERIIKDVDSSLADLCAFLGVRYIQYPEDKREKHEGKPRVTGWLIRTLSRLGISVKSGTRLSGSVRPLVRFLSQVSNPSVLSSKEIALLRSFYSYSNVVTSGLVGIDLQDYGYPV